MLDRVRARPGQLTLLALATILALLAGLVPAAGAGMGPPSQPGVTFDFQGELAGRADLDARQGRVPPTAAQEQAAERLGAVVRWNDLGTPAVLTSRTGTLGTGLGSEPAAAARRWLAANRALFRLSEQGLDALELLHVAPIGSGHAVTFRQRFEGLPAVHDGLVTVAVLRGHVIHAVSSLTPDSELSGQARLEPQQAYRIAASHAGRPLAAGDLRPSGRTVGNGWSVLSARGLTGPQLVRLGALPTPRQGVRPVFDTVVNDVEEGAEPLAVRTLVDAETGQVLLREDQVDYAQGEDPSAWSVFPGSPPLDYRSTDTRELWCWDPSSRECDRVLRNDAAGVPWDVDPVTGEPSHTSSGNAALGVEKWDVAANNAVGTSPATPRADRRYTYPWTNQWFEERCDPAVFDSPQRNDIDAAIANLFAMHNRMHDWSYRLGFTENNFNLQRHNFGRGGREGDPEQGNAQAGGRVGGPPTFVARDNANQITPPDGVAPITNMFLWQPIAGGFYAPCVDGDYDMSVIGHEYTHAISNRMVAGPDQRLVGAQANAMGESWSDLVAMEILNEYGSVPIADENRYAIGTYVTGDKQAGIRNYGMNASPLNYSDIGYDITGVQVHADGEIWSATNFAIRQALTLKYALKYPPHNQQLQLACAQGQRPVDRCPGNRRWIQLVFDAWLLMPAEASMVDARDAMLAADRMRFGGENQAVLWTVFASRGLGEGAASQGPDDPDPVPDFTSPFAPEGTLRFQPTNTAGKPVVAQLFVGHYEARATPVADTDPATELDETVRLVPGVYDLIVRADGYGMHRTKALILPGTTRRLAPRLERNLASLSSGATITGDGVNLTNLIDDTEATNWASSGAPVEGRQVTVALDPSRSAHRIDRVQVSALLRAPNPNDHPTDPGAANRFSALRQFQILTCTAKPGTDCTQDAHFRLVYTSPADAFPSAAPRPRAPDMIMRSFDIPDVTASHVRLRVVTNQCTGGPDFQGEQDNDPRADTDCSDASPQALIVRAAELQVFGRH